MPARTIPSERADAKAWQAWPDRGCRRNICRRSAGTRLHPAQRGRTGSWTSGISSRRSNRRCRARSCPRRSSSEPRAFPQARAEDRMSEIGPRLVERGDGEPDRRGALPEARDLGKDEPHPVALFPPRPKLPANLIIDGRLRVDEALQIESVVRDGALGHWSQLTPRSFLLRVIRAARGRLDRLVFLVHGLQLRAHRIIGEAAEGKPQRGIWRTPQLQ